MSFQRSGPDSWGGHESSRLPPGFRFCPTDEELVSYYLTRKILDSRAAFQAIGVVDFNKCEPWDLQTRSQADNNAFYFFTLKDRKYPTGMRTNRATAAGYWKATGKDREVVTRSSGRSGGRISGFKKTLVFYTGRAPKGLKTNWVMHEYRLDGESLPDQQEWVVCRVFEKISSIKKIPALEPSSDSEYSNVQPGSFLDDVQTMESTGFRSVKPNYSLAGRIEKSPSIKMTASESTTSSEYSNGQRSSFLPGLQSIESDSLRPVKPNYSSVGHTQIPETQGYSQSATYPENGTNFRRTDSNLKLKKDWQLGDTLENLVSGWDTDIYSPEALWYPSAAP